MFPHGLCEVCAIVGVALLTLAFVVLRHYKEKTQKVVSDEISRLLITREVSDFAKKIETKNVTFKMVSDFYDQFADANEPNVILKRVWRDLLISGILFIVASVSGYVDFFPFDLISWQTIGIGFFGLGYAMFQVVKLENKL